MSFWETFVDNFIGPIVTNLICMPWYRPLFEDLKNLKGFNLERARNVRIPVLNDDSSTELRKTGEIGAWFMGPRSETSNQETNTLIQEETLETDNVINESESKYIVGAKETVILYLHGNSNTRSATHRREWYKLWQLNGFYVLAIDYRGYGDSSGISQITETSLVHDAMSAFVWLQKSIHPESQIMVWGHSLGTGVACRLGWNLKVCDKRPVGYILEAPFDSMHSVISQLGETGSGIFGFTMGTLSKFLNYIFDTKEMLEKRDLIFDSEKSLLEVKEKVIILHAKDDSVVPFQLGAKLYKNMVEKSKDIDIFSFDEEHALGHDDIYKYKEIDNIIKDISKMK